MGPLFRSSPDNNQNVVIGDSTTLPNPAANSNLEDIAIGSGALNGCATCNSMVATGFQAGQDVASGRASLFEGFVAGGYAVAPLSDTFIGAFAGRGGTPSTPATPQLGTTGGIGDGADNTCIGEAACLYIHGAAQSNNAHGFNALVCCRPEYGK